MSPEERELLSKTHHLATENNEILRSLRRSQRWQTFWSLLRWVIIIGSALLAYYQLQPYLDKLFAVYNKLPLEQLQNLPNLGSLLPR